MKKIMFNDRYGLTDAVLQGKKTVTRRLLKPTKPRSLANCLKGLKYECLVDEDGNNYEAPYYVGEIVAVAQSYGAISYNISKIPSVKRAEFYCDIMCKCYPSKSYPVDYEEIAGWNNKMFVCADLMPRQIRILDVRAERLQDITDEDCLREGLDHDGELPYIFDDKLAHRFYYDTPRKAFSALIDKISGKGTWNVNPYVWRIEFELAKYANRDPNKGCPDYTEAPQHLFTMRNIII